jgi:HD-GYP domain-containing protein (c-di-GMP phosphodiesterase class II)
MVKFSKILGSRDKRARKIGTSKEDTRVEKIRMSSLPIGQTKETAEDIIEADVTQYMQEDITEDTEESADTFLAGRYGERVKTHFSELLKVARDIRDRVRNNKEINHTPVRSVLRDIINADVIDQLYEYAILFQNQRGLRSHIMSVTLASLKVGSGLGYEKEKLLKLALAAFLENVGMYQIPDHILNKNGKLSSQEMAAVRKHPEISAQILGGMGESFQWLAEVALEVHERSDGSGYPKGVKEEGISEFASIIGLAETYTAMIKAEVSEFASIIGLSDTYVAMTQNRPHRAKFMQTEAVKAIVGSGKGKFPSRVFKEFLDQISLFPVNTYVRLNNKSIGRVLSTDKAQPLRPTIELIFDGLGEKAEKRKVIHLSKSPLLYIVEAIDEKELPE